MNGKESRVTKLFQVISKMGSPRYDDLELTSPTQPPHPLNQEPARSPQSLEVPPIPARELARLQELMEVFILGSLESVLNRLQLKEGENQVSVSPFQPLRESSPCALVTFRLDLGLQLPLCLAVQKGLATSDTPYPQEIIERSDTLAGNGQLKAIAATLFAAFEMRGRLLQGSGWVLTTDPTNQNDSYLSVSHQPEVTDPRIYTDLDRFFSAPGLTKADVDGRIRYFLPRVDQFTVLMKKLSETTS